MRAIALCLSFCFMAGGAAAQPLAGWRASTPQEQHLDAVAFEGFATHIGERLGDVQSVVVAIQGRVAFEYYRDGNPDALRDVQSVTKSALSLLVGTALQRGQIASLDQPVLDLMPEWRALNADPRTQAITLRHLLTMTPGFEVGAIHTGTSPALSAEAAWVRALGAAPGQRFAYDNSVPLLVAALLERAAGRPLAELARAQLVMPLAMHEPAYVGSLVHLRTLDMAKLGHLLLRDGHWGDQPLLPAGFAAQVVAQQNAGGPPVGLPYGLFWWVPSASTYFASGHAGQLVWVHAPMDLVIAITSTVSSQSQQRGQALGLARGRIFQAARKRLSLGP